MPSPRPFVLRAAHLDARHYAPGEAFSFDINVFDLRAAMLDRLMGAFSEWACTGLGPRRGRVELVRWEDTAVTIQLMGGLDVSKCSLLFRTPTELKGNPSREGMPFPVLFARVRERIGALCSIYGDGTPPMDFRAMSERVRSVRTVRCDLRYREVWRRSSRTGAVHRIGGVTGRVDFAGDLTELIPWLRAASWAGVGRHTVWGNGAIEVLDPGEINAS